MGRYFGREPRYSREEIERQAQEAIDARVSLGRPPDEDFRPLEERLAQIDRMAAARPPLPSIPEPEPLRLREIRIPKVAATQSPERATPEPTRRPVAARPAAN